MAFAPYIEASRFGGLHLAIMAVATGELRLLVPSRREFPWTLRYGLPTASAWRTSQMRDPPLSTEFSTSQRRAYRSPLGCGKRPCWSMLESSVGLAGYR